MTTTEQRLADALRAVIDTAPCGVRANAMDSRAIMRGAIRRERDDARRKAKHLTDFMRSKKRAFSKGVTE